MDEKLSAVVWDFDGTLVDTRQKNLNVTRALVERTSGLPADAFPALRSLAEYERALRRHRHWQEFYRVELRMSDAQIERAGEEWARQQVADATLAPAYEGIPTVLEHLAGAALPQGIVSLNATDNIRRLIGALGLQRHFDTVIGYEAFPPERQKPAPDALVRCIEELTGLAPGTVAYVGDHEADAECVHNANAWLRSRGFDLRVLAVSAQYAPYADDSSWETPVDFRAGSPAELLAFFAARVAGNGAR